MYFERVRKLKIIIDIGKASAIFVSNYYLMKKVILFLIFVISSCSVQAQASLGISKTIINFPDTVNEGDTTTFTVYLKNYGPSDFNGDVTINMAIDSGSVPPHNSILLDSVSNFKPGDSLAVMITETFSAPSYSKGKNIVVIWPSALNTNTQDSLRAEVYVIDITGIKDPVLVSQLLKLYPNPVVNQLNLQIAADNVIAEEIRIINSAGQVLKLIYNSNTISFSDLPAGSYHLAVRTKEKVVSLKVIKVE